MKFIVLLFGMMYFSFVKKLKQFSPKQSILIFYVGVGV